MNKKNRLTRTSYPRLLAVYTGPTVSKIWMSYGEFRTRLDRDALLKI